jgi:hypothetical protein
MVSEVSVQDQLAPLLLSPWQGRSIMEEYLRKLLTSSQPGSKEE